jgi:hypothetical protein
LSTDIASINRRADDFRDLDEPIAHNFSDILIITMNCLFKLHQALKESSYGGEARQSVSCRLLSTKPPPTTFLLSELINSKPVLIIPLSFVYLHRKWPSTARRRGAS